MSCQSSEKRSHKNAKIETSLLWNKSKKKKTVWSLLCSCLIPSLTVRGLIKKSLLLFCNTITCKQPVCGRAVLQKYCDISSVEFPLFFFPSSGHFLLFIDPEERDRRKRKRRSWCGTSWDKEEENIVVSRDYSLCSQPDVIYAIITEYRTRNLNRAQLLFYSIILLIIFLTESMLVGFC